MNDIRGVVFDIDDTVVNLSESKAAAYAWVKNKGVDVDLLHAAELVLWDQFGRGEITREILGLERWKACGLSQAAIDDIEPSFEAIIDAVNPIPGCVELFRSLKKANYKIGILSNGTTIPQQSKLARVGLAPFIDAVLTSQDLGIGKPHPLAFATIAEALGLPSSQCAMVGDNYKYDIEGALNAGFAQAVWVAQPFFNSHQIELFRQEHPDLIYAPNLSSIPSVLDLDLGLAH